MIVNMGKGGHVKRKEPEVHEIMEAYEDNRLIFDRAHWYLYYTKLYGYHYVADRAFAESFNGHRARIANMVRQVIEESIAATCNLPTDDEKWFKKKLITGGDVNQFLKP